MQLVQIIINGQSYKEFLSLGVRRFWGRVASIGNGTAYTKRGEHMC